jgi:hypothetical protein
MFKIGDIIENTVIPINQNEKLGVIIWKFERPGTYRPGKYYELTSFEGYFWELLQSNQNLKKVGEIDLSLWHELSQKSQEG